MNNELNDCNAVHTTAAGTTYRCDLPHNHGGLHKRMALNGTYAHFSWARTETTPTPGAKCRVMKDNWTCTLTKGHAGEHEAHGGGGRVYSTWFNEEWGKIKELELPKGFLGPKTDEVVLTVTLEELKGLVYALSGPEWLEDEPELVAKIDKALKEAL